VLLLRWNYRTDSETLRRLAKSRAAPARTFSGHTQLLWAGERMANARIAQKAGVMPDTVRVWRVRHVADGLAQFAVARPGRRLKPPIPPARVATNGYA